MCGIARAKCPEGRSGDIMTSRPSTSGMVMSEMTRSTSGPASSRRNARRPSTAFVSPLLLLVVSIAATAGGVSKPAPASAGAPMSHRARRGCACILQAVSSTLDDLPWIARGLHSPGAWRRPAGGGPDRHPGLGGHRKAPLRSRCAPRLQGDARRGESSHPGALAGDPASEGVRRASPTRAVRARARGRTMPCRGAGPRRADPLQSRSPFRLSRQASRTIDCGGRAGAAGRPAVRASRGTDDSCDGEGTGGRPGVQRAS